MKKNQIKQDRYQGILIVAFAIVAQQGPENLPNDVPDNPEEELSENEPDETPEMPDQDDLGIDEELGNEEENEFPEIDEQEEDEREIDEREIDDREEANDGALANDGRTI